MALDSNRDKDTWLPACDLCGGFGFDTVGMPGDAVARRCRTCGLVTLSPPDPRRHPCPSGSTRTVAPTLGRMFASLLRSAPRGGSVLLLGAESLSLAATALDAGLSTHAVIPPGTSVPKGVVPQGSSIENASYAPDYFDIIASAIPLDTVQAPSTVFEKSRLWLKAGGSLLLSGCNYGSLAARLWRRNWLASHATETAHLLTPEIIRAYADRMGYQIKALETRSGIGPMARLVAGASHPSLPLRIVLAPLSFLSNMLNIGDDLFVVLEKRGPAVVPIQKIMPERDEAPGLAPAMYAGIRREGIVDR